VIRRIMISEFPECLESQGSRLRQEQSTPQWNQP
jgi:hypothetical protein